MKSSALRAAAVASIAMLAIGAAPAPDPPVSDWSNIETVIVKAQRGPAMWRITKGDAEVWILPTVGPVPKSLQWETSAVSDVLKGATALWMPPRASVGVFEGVWFWMTGMSALEQPDGVTLESTLHDPLKARFIAARTTLGKDAEEYSEYLPAVAAAILERDFWKANDLANDTLPAAIEHLASRQGVPVKVVATIQGLDVIKDVPKLSTQAQLACLDAALTDIDTQRVHAAAAAQAWAVGNIDGVKANYSEIRLGACLQASAIYASLREKAIADTTNAILGALARPGKTVFVVPLGDFLRNKSVMDRLIADGAVVSGPGS
jgi:TraB/PrgY/gumN family